jgi:hypothetical protein
VRGSTPEVDEINRQLREHYGADANDRDAPIWRVVWSDDQIEKRETEWSEEGFRLLFPKVDILPKYQWIKERWILERLVLVPEINSREMLGKKVSYECIYIYETQQGDFLPPNFNAAKFVIDLVYAARGKKSMRKYVDDAVKDENREARIAKLTEDLFGNETLVGDALAHGDGVSLSGPKFGETK